MVTENHLDPLSGSEKSNADGFVLLSEGKNPSIIIYAGSFKVLDGGSVFQGSFAIGSDSINGSNGKVGRQTKFRSDILVNHMVNYHAVSQVLVR